MAPTPAAYTFWASGARSSYPFHVKRAAVDRTDPLLVPRLPSVPRETPGHRREARDERAGTGRGAWARRAHAPLRRCRGNQDPGAVPRGPDHVRDTDLHAATILPSIAPYPSSASTCRLRRDTASHCLPAEPDSPRRPTRGGTSNGLWSEPVAEGDHRGQRCGGGPLRRARKAAAAGCAAHVAPGCWPTWTSAHRRCLCGHPHRAAGSTTAARQAHGDTLHLEAAATPGLLRGRAGGATPTLTSIAGDPQHRTSDGRPRRRAASAPTADTRDRGSSRCRGWSLVAAHQPVLIRGPWPDPPPDPSSPRAPRVGPPAPWSAHGPRPTNTNICSLHRPPWFATLAPPPRAGPPIGCQEGGGRRSPTASCAAPSMTKPVTAARSPARPAKTR